VNSMWLLVGYLCGSIPTGLLVVRMVKGVDIRTYGSGNIGATNVGRVLGKPWAVAVALLDMVKGGVAVTAARLAGVHDPWLLAGIAFCGVCGHNFPVWLGFKGGKGVATSFGVVFFITPVAAPAGGALWFALMKGTGYVSVASMVSLCTMPLTMWLVDAAGSALVRAGTLSPETARFLFGTSPATMLLGGALGLLTVFRHRANIGRLLAGTENKVGRKP